MAHPVLRLIALLKRLFLGGKRIGMVLWKKVARQIVWLSILLLRVASRILGWSDSQDGTSNSSHIPSDEKPRTIPRAPGDIIGSPSSSTLGQSESNQPIVPESGRILCSLQPTPFLYSTGSRFMVLGNEQLVPGMNPDSLVQDRPISRSSSWPPFSRNGNEGGDIELTALAPSIVPPDGSISDEETPCLNHDRIFPITPDFFMRYDKHKFAKNKETKMVIKAMTLDFCPHPDPPGWKPITHPEGVLYFYNEEKKTVTDANLYDPVYYEQITSNIATLEEHVRSNSIRLPERYTLAMDLNMQSHKEIFTDYYYADHDRKVIFFLDDLDTSTNLQVWNQVKGVTSLAHVRHEFEAQYWTHGMLYPSTIELTDALVADLRAILLHFIGDTVTSSFSTSPYSRSELRELLSDVTSAKENVSTPLDYHGTATFICRLMWIFARNNFYHRYSGPEVRLYADQSAHGKAVRHRTILMKVLSPLLFSAPDSHLRNFESAWVDGILSGAFWLDLYKKLNSEAQEYNLTATVMLNVNVAFLAIQSVDLQESQGRSPGQVAAYLSVACSLGSIVAGLLLTRHLRKNQSSLDSVAAFLKARSHPTLALELLSILHSLPYAFLLWAMISFLVAFIWHTADNSDTVTRLLTGIAWAMLAVCVAWYVWVDWAQHDGDGDQSPEAGDGGGTEADSGGELGGQETATGFKPVWIRLWERLRGGLFRISRQSPSEGTQQLADGTRVEV